MDNVMVNRAKIISLIVCPVLVILGSCSPRIIEHAHTDIVYRDRIVRDSLYFRDSVFVSEKVKGDTVYIDRFKYKYIYKDKYKIDTLIKVQTDSVFVEKKVEKQLTPMQRIKQDTFWWFVIAAVGLFLWTFRKHIKLW